MEEGLGVLDRGNSKRKSFQQISPKPEGASRKQ